MTARQLVLNLEHRAALGRDDFLVSPANRDAVTWIDAWPEWPGYALALYGETGCGKSHLGHVWRRRSGAPALALESLGPEMLPDLAIGTGLALEVGSLIPDQRLLLHLMNLMRAERTSLLLLAREAPARWDIGLPDLASRLAAVPAVRMNAPDDALFEAILVKLFADRQVRPEPAALAFLSRRLERSFAAAARAVERLDQMALAEQRGVTLGLARRLLAEDGAP